MAVKTLYVGNLSTRTTADDLHRLFGNYGTVTTAEVLLDRETGKSRGFAFVGMADGADAAVAAVNGRDFQGRRLSVSEARTGAARGGRRK